MTTAKYKKIRLFVLISFLIGIFLSLIQYLGYFSRVDAAAIGVPVQTVSGPSFHLDGVLAILFFAVVPGVFLFIWTQQKALLVTFLALALYYAAAWFYLQQVGVLLPLVAPTVATLACVIRAFGWKPVLDNSRSSTETPEPAKSWLFRFLEPRLFGEEEISAQPLPSNSGKKSGDVFLSYRREGGAETARLIRVELCRRGVGCFLDVDDLGASHFDERLLHEITRRPNFVVILSPGCLDRCSDEADWLRREIAFAISKGKNVVPILKDGFEFPSVDALPGEIADLPRYNCVLYSHAYFSPAIERLFDFLQASEKEQIHKEIGSE